MGVIFKSCRKVNNHQLVINDIQFKQLTDDIDFSTIIKNFFNKNNEEIGEKLNLFCVVKLSQNEVDQLAQEYLINLIILDFCYKKLGDNQYIGNTIQFYFNLFMYSLHTFQNVTQHSNYIWFSFISNWFDHILSLYENISKHWNSSLFDQDFKYKKDDLENEFENINNNETDSQCIQAIKILQQIVNNCEFLDQHPFYLIQREIAQIRKKYQISN